MRPAVLALLLTACGPKQLRVPGDPALQGFLDGVLSAVARHDWDTLYDACDERHVQTQVGEFGMSRGQYLAEILGLNFVDNRIDDDGDGADEGDLARILRLEPAGPVRPTADGSPTTVRGRAVLTDGTTLRFELMVHPTPDGPKLTGGVG
jgi:hypothetical protein